MEKNEEKQEIENPEIELSEEELDEASGGIIIVGGTPQKNARFRLNPNIAALNPQPLPPGPDANKIQNIGKLGSH